MVSVLVILASRLIAFLQRLRAALAEQRVSLSRKCLDEIEEMGWLEQDVLLTLLDLRASDFERVEDSRALPGALIWVFCPEDASFDRLWIRIGDDQGRMFVVVSFHPWGEP